MQRPRRKAATVESHRRRLVARVAGASGCAPTNPCNRGCQWCPDGAKGGRTQSIWLIGGSGRRCKKGGCNAIGVRTQSIWWFGESGKRGKKGGCNAIGVRTQSIWLIGGSGRRGKKGGRITLRPYTEYSVDNARRRRKGVACCAPTNLCNRGCQWCTDGLKGGRPVRATSGQRGNHTATPHAARCVVEERWTARWASVHRVFG